MTSDRSALPREPYTFWLRRSQTVYHMHAIPRHILRVVFSL